MSPFLLVTNWLPACTQRMYMQTYVHATYVQYSIYVCMRTHTYVRNYIYVYIYIYIYIYSTVVPNSRDHYEYVWLSKNKRIEK